MDTALKRLTAISLRFVLSVVSHTLVIHKVLAINDSTVFDFQIGKTTLLAHVFMNGTHKIGVFVKEEYKSV